MTMWVTTILERRSDGGITPVHEIVIKALEQHDGIDPHSGEWTLYDYIDPDSLDDLFSKEGNTVTSVEFTVKGATVTVWQDGEVHAKVE